MLWPGVGEAFRVARIGRIEHGVLNFPLLQLTAPVATDLNASEFPEPALAKDALGCVF